MSTAAAPTLAQYLADNPNADPRDLLQVVMAETERIKETAASREHEYKIASEVALDENLNPQPKTLAQLFRAARMYVDGGMVPDSYFPRDNKPFQPVPAVAIAIQFAQRMGVDTLTFLQSSFPHKGKIGVDAKLTTGRLITSGKIVGRPEYSFERNDAGQVIKCTCTVTDKESGEKKSQTVTWEMVEAEGWHLNNGSQKSKWITLRELMFQYRSATLLSRVHYPDVLLGMYTIDELEDMTRNNAEANGTAAVMSDLQELSERLGAAPKPQPGKRPRKTAETRPAEDTLEEAGDKEPAEPATEKTAETPPAKTSGKKAAASTPVESKAPETKAEEAKTAKEQPPAQPKRAPATETAKQAPAAPTGPVGSSSPSQSSPPAQPRKSPSMTPEGLKSYMRMRWEDDCGAFDMDRLARIASSQANPMGYIDLIVSRQNPNWQNFIAQETPESQSGELAQEGVDDGPAAEDVNQGGEDGATEQTDEDKPKCVTNPMPRPSMEMDDTAYELERQICGKRNPELIRQFASSQVKGHPDLIDRVIDYLLDLAERRAWQLENNIQTTDRAAK